MPETLAVMPPRTPPRELAWCPYDMEAWESLCNGLTAEEERALHRAFRKAWSDTDAPCTLIDRPDAWERLLGARWRALSAFLRTHFVADPTHPGRVVWPRILALRVDQLAKYEAYAAAGKKAWAKPGGKRGPKPKPKPEPNSRANSEPNSRANSEPNSRANSEPNSRANSQAIAYSKRGFTPEPYGSGGETPGAAVASAAPDGAAAPSPRPGNGVGPRPDDAPDVLPPELGDAVDWRALLRDSGTRPPPAPLSAEPPPPDALAELAAVRERRLAWEAQRAPTAPAPTRPAPEPPLEPPLEPPFEPPLARAGPELATVPPDDASPHPDPEG